MYRRQGFNCVVCELRFFSELTITDYAGVANTQHAQIAIFKFAIYLAWKVRNAIVLLRD